MKSEALAPLVGARVRRVDLPHDDLAALTVSLEAGGAHLPRVLLLSLSSRAPGLGLTEERPHGAPASAFCQLLRKHLEGAVVVSVAADDERVVLRLRRGPERPALVLRAGALALDLEGREHTHRPRDAEPIGAIARWRGTDAASREALEEAGAALLAARARDDRDGETVSLLRALSALEKRLRARLLAVRKDLARGEEIPTLRRNGTLLLSNLPSVSRGAASVRLLDHAEEPPQEIEIALDPARDAREQARAFFDRARKLERGARFSEARLAETAALLERARALGLALARPDTTDAAIDEARTFVDTQAPSRGRPARGAGGRGEPRLPYRRIVGHGEREIRVGRGARDNDELTQKHAAPHDLWLHARGVPGAHVVVPLARGEVCPPELLLDAATLAAHFSALAGERVVEVDHVARGKVRKRKGMAPGLVEVDHPKTLALRLEPARLARMLGKA